MPAGEKEPNNEKNKDDDDEDDDDMERLEYKLYTAESWENQLHSEETAKDKAEENKRNQGEAHLVDGELRFDSEEDHGPAKTRNPDYIEGNTLPEDSGCSKEIYGKPIEEIDKLITDKTFVIIAERFKKEYIFRFSSTRSLYLLPPWNPIRRATLYVATSQYFDYFIILTILTNCVFLAMPDNPSAETAEYIFLAIYTLEMIIKLLARGFIINSYTYLRDAWNWLDFLVIISAYLTIVLDSTMGSSGVGNLQGIRTFRVFRVLRTVSIVPGLKTIVNALLRAFRLLLEVMMLILFCLMVFALFALQIYMGALRQKCVQDVTGYVTNPSYTYAQYYNDYIKNSSHWLVDDDDSYRVCGNASSSRSCPPLYVCLEDIGENPNFGYTSFDHFGWALLTSFQLITLDFWEDTYNKVLFSSGPWNVIFFVFVVFFGAFYLVNLMLAVVAMSYEEESEATSKEKEKENQNKNKKKKKKAKQEKDALKELALATTAGIRAAVESSQALGKRSKTIIPTDTGSDTTVQRKMIQRRPMIKMQSKDSGTGNSLESSRSNGSKEGDYLMHGDEGSYASSNMDSGFKKDMELKPKLFKKPFVKQTSSGMPEVAMNDVSSSGVNLTPSKTPETLEYQPNLEELYDEDEKETSEGRDYVKEHYPHVVIIDVEQDTFDEKPDKGELRNRNCDCCYSCCCKGHGFVPWLRIQAFFFLIVSEPLFDLFIMLCIVLNTVFMMLEHHGMSAELELSLKISNYVFTGIFTLEAILKISALTRFYFKIGWNVFDLVIVIASLVDLGVEDIDGLSVMRTFRLLRVFKLAQSWPTMRLLLSIIMNTLGALANLTMILCIVIYIFAVIGLQLFNKSYTEDKFAPDPVPRWHFKDIFHSFMMIFRVLCGEWIEPLWDCMRAADEVCMAVFLPTLIIGNFIVLNLFLALLLNAFASDTLRKAKEDADDNKLKLAFARIYDLCCCCLKKKKSHVNSVGPDEFDDDHSLVDLDKNDQGMIMKPILGNGTQLIEEGQPSDPKQPNGNVTGKDRKDIDKAFSTKREQYSDFNKALANKKDTKDTTIKEEEDKDKTKETEYKLPQDPNKKVHVIKPDRQYYKIPIVKKTPTDKEKRAAELASGTAHVDNSKHEDDDLELGAEAATLKKEKSDESVEEEEKVIEIVDCFPFFLTKRLRKRNWCMGCFNFFGERWFKFRVLMNMIVEHKAFESVILFLIGASSISLAFEDVYLYDNQVMTDALYWLNIIFATLFAVEMFLKWFAYGFKKYFTNFWTILDFAIVVISFASLIAEATGGANFSAFRSLRTLRALRPLRAISRWQGMRIVVNALMMAIPAIVNVLLVCVVFWLIFSIMGVQFFAGKFYKCLDANGNKLAATVVKNKVECLAMASTMNYTWRNSYVTFDNVGSGYLALFQVATFEGWMEVMEDAIDSTDVDLQPSYENSLYYYLYFVAFIIFGSFFTLNLFIGVIIDNFNVLKKRYDGSYLDMFLTSGQRQYYNTIKRLGNKKPQKTIKRPKSSINWLNKLHGIFYDISISNKFELCIIIIIFLNMTVMAVEYYKQPDSVTDVLDIFNMIFVIIFALEAIVKIIGLRWHYFRQPWNVFDFIVVVLSLLGVILADVLQNLFVSPTLLRVIRVFRIGRVLRLVKAAKGIRKLLFALIISLPALFNIGMLLMLIMYIYAIICLSTFQNLKITGALDDDVVNFKTFTSSFMLLFRISTSAGWNDILEPMLIQAPDCNPDYYTRPDDVQVKESNGDCGTPWMAVFCLTSYILVIFLVVINMFIAVILENFNQAHEQEEVGITEDDFEMFYQVWERYDPLATQFIKYEQLSIFVSDLEPPLGIPKPNEIALVSFDLPIVEGDKLHCLDVLMALVKYVLGNVEESPEFMVLHEQMEQRFMTAFPTRVNTTKKSSTMARKKEDVAAKTLQRAWRSWKAQKQMKNIAALAMQQQHEKKAAAHHPLDARRKTSSIFTLGQRLSTALSTFFIPSRPSSAISRLSVRSSDPAASSAAEGKKPNKKRVQSSLELPQVSTLYSVDHDNDVEL